MSEASPPSSATPSGPEGTTAAASTVTGQVTAPPRPRIAVSGLREDLLKPDPLLDCLVEICRLHGRSATRASLSAGLPLAGEIGRAHV